MVEVDFKKMAGLFSSPFLGTFFQLEIDALNAKLDALVFVPFLGDFLSMFMGNIERVVTISFSSPFLGTFFQ